MSLQRLFSSVTNLCELASKTFLCQSKASLHEHNSTMKLCPKPIQTIASSRFVSALGVLPLKFISWHQKIRNFSKLHKIRYGHYLPPIQLSFEFERKNRRFEKQYVANKRADQGPDSNNIKHDGENQASTLILDQPVKRSNRLRTPNFYKIHKTSYSLMIQQEEAEKLREDIKKIIRPPIFYGQPTLRAGRTHKSSLIKSFSNQIMQN